MIVALLNQKSCVGKAALTLHLAGELTCKGNRFALLAALVLLKCNRRRSTDWRWPRFWRASAMRASAGPSGVFRPRWRSYGCARDRGTRERDPGDRAMGEQSGQRYIASRPSGPDTRIKPAVGALGTVNQSAFVVRPTTDMTPQVRDRIAAFQRNVIVAETLREMLSRAFPATSGEPS